MPTRTIAYLRSATEDQGSLDIQRASVEAYARLHGFELVEVAVDLGKSGTTLNRPGIQRALAGLRAGKAEALLVSRLDRVSRNSADLGRLLEEVKKGRWALLSVDDSPSQLTNC